MRPSFWLIPLVLLGCSRQDEDDGLVTQPTRVRVSPAVFLGDVECSEEGGMHTYQATLLDVTEGLEGAFRLPSSDVVSCDRDVEFQYVRAGRRYIAQVSAFARSDISAQNPGSPVIVDDEGMAVSPRWTTTCWGYDDLLPIGMGGAQGDLDAQGGAGGASSVLGVESFSKTIVTVRGCEPLDGPLADGPTAVAFDISSALLGISCGSNAGDVGDFTVRLAGEDEMTAGGAGGMGGAPMTDQPSALCGETLTLEDVPPSERLTFIAEGFDAESGAVIWTSTCRALSVAGVTVRASCDPAPAL